MKTLEQLRTEYLNAKIAVQQTLEALKNHPDNFTYELVHMISTGMFDSKPEPIGTYHNFDDMLQGVFDKGRELYDKEQDYALFGVFTKDSTLPNWSQISINEQYKVELRLLTEEDRA